MQSDVPSKAWLQNILNGLTDTAVGKLASERYLNLYAREYGVSTTALRLFNVYGPGQNLENLNQGMASIFLAQALKNKNVLVIGSPDRFRDFVYIDDVVSVLIGSLDIEDRGFNLYNVCSGKKQLLVMLLIQLNFVWVLILMLIILGRRAEMFMAKQAITPKC